MSDLNQIRFWKVPDILSGNGFFFGRIGSGKSWKMITVVQGFHSKNYKIFDVFGGKRNEGPFWCFPSDEKKLWFDFLLEAGSFKGDGPKAYNVNLLFPMFSNSLPNKLPEDLPRVKSKIFTIPLHSITLSDISLVIGDLSSTAKFVWNYIISHTNANSNGADVDFIMNHKLKKYLDFSIYKLFIKPLVDNNLISSEHYKYNIDIISEAQEKNIVSVLCHEYIPEEFRYFLMGWLMRNLMKLAMEDKIGKKNIAVFREASMFMKIQDKNLSGADMTQIFRNQLSEIARYARSGVFLFLDTQSPSEVHGLISGQEDIMGITEMPSLRDREELTKPLKQDRRISDAQIRYIATIPLHQIVFVERGQKAKLVRRIQPPRTMCWKQGMGNFTSTWKKLIDKYMTTNLMTEDIKNEYSNNLRLREEAYELEMAEKIKEFHELEEEKAKIKKQRRKEMKEEKTEPEVEVKPLIAEENVAENVEVNEKIVEVKQKPTKKFNLKYDPTIIIE